MKKNDSTVIAVVCGGPSAEAEVSRLSGQTVANALKATFTNVFTVELNSAIDQSLRKINPHVVYPALHGPPGEDGTFQGFLDIMGIRYVGSSVAASSVAMDKILSKQLFKLAGIPVAQDVVVYKNEDIKKAEQKIIEKLGTDVVVKPSRQGSALGVSFVHDSVSLSGALKKAFTYDDYALVEKCIVGKEITCGILDRDTGSEALPVLEVRTPKNSWYDFEHRYAPGLSTHIIPAQIPTEQYARVQKLAVKAHAALGCRDLSRADFVVPEKGEPILLEVNNLPGMTPTSLYPDEAKAAGISFEELVTHLIKRALSR